ncbi:MAG TPA: AsmA family protein [Paucimonas sp.]|nr:AsmA family protein [Paucimonas sp.]
MPKPLKIALIVLAAALGVTLTAAAIVAATFNPNDYKPLIIKLVQEKKQRTLSIPGEIKLTFFPKIGADLGKLSISEHGAPETFASIEHAKVSVALFPLLFSSQLVVDRVVVDGLHANLRRNKDGSTNFDDLMSKEESGEQIKFDIDGVQVTKGLLTFDDRMAGRKLTIAELRLETGKIADRAASKFDIAAAVKSSQPAMDAKVSAKSGFTLDLANRHVVLRDIDAAVMGKVLDFSDVQLTLKGAADLRPDAKQFTLDGIVFGFDGKQGKQAIEFKFEAPKLAITDRAVSGGKLAGDAKLTEGSRTVSAKFATPSFEGSPQAFKLPALTLDAAIKDAGLDAALKLSGALAGNLDKMAFSSPQLTLALDGKQGGNAINGSLTTPLVADLQAQTIALPTIAGSFTLPNPGGGTLKWKTNGRADIDLGKRTATAALKGDLDESRYDARFGVNRFSPLAFNFDIGFDRIDLDRYRVNKPAVGPASAPAASAPGAPEKPIDLSALKTLNANGTLRVDAAKVQNMKVSNLRVGMRAANGKAEIHSLNANLYGGTVTGSLSATATEPPQFTARQNLAGINIGALLKDAIGKDPIDGKGNVQIDIAAQGATVSQMKRALGGTARIELRDGAVRGVNVAQVIRDAKARIGALRGNSPGAQPAAQTGTGSTDQKTDFSELSGSFRIAKGVARNEDLSIKSPLLRIGGAGDVNLGAERLDYLVKATVVSTLQGQGGPELQALKGVTVPVRLSGPFAAIGWKIDFGALAGDIAKQKLDEKKEDVKKKLQEQLQDKLKGLFGK